MDILVVSPVASHPQNQGNSARIFALGELLRSFGARVHFVYVTFEGINPESFGAMKAAWDSFDVVHRSTPKSHGSAECFLIDDWYEPALDPRLRELFQQRHYDMMIVNYVWISRCLLVAPPGCLKVLDSHDVFGGRHRRLLADQIAPAWYYTSPEEEAKGLNRADVVLAIQDEEAEIFRSVTDKPVLVAGHVTPARFMPPRHHSGKPKIGYIASGNVNNVNSLRSTCQSIRSRPDLLKRFDFVLAGSICDSIGEGRDVFVPLGYVSDVADFYASVDVTINPNLGGTGLKIKSVEALSFGRPLVSTVDGMLGIESDNPDHRCRDSDDLAAALERLRSLEILAESSRQVFVRYQKAQFEALQRLLGMVGERPGQPGGRRVSAVAA